MIASLSGEITFKRYGALVINVSGVGFEVRVTPHLLVASQVGDNVSLSIRMLVREDEISLYGFSSEAELDVFDKLCSVSGVGPKVALGAIGTLSSEDLVRAIADGDENALTAVPGIGLKTAKQLILSLTGKVTTGPGVIGNQSQAVIDGLIGLGVPAVESGKLVKAALENLGEKAQESDLLREALRIRRG